MRSASAAERGPTLAGPHALGTAAMLTSSAFLLQWLALGVGDHSGSAVAAVLNLLFLGGWSCSVIGLWRLGTLGVSGTGRVVVAVQLLGLGLAASQEVQDLVHGSADWGSSFYRLTDAAWPLSVLFMLVVGAATLRAGVWAGWQRFAPGLCGLALPIGLALRVAAGERAMQLSMVFLFTVGWMLLGYAVRRGGRVTEITCPTRAPDHQH